MLCVFILPSLLHHPFLFAWAWYCSCCTAVVEILFSTHLCHVPAELWPFALPCRCYNEEGLSTELSSSVRSLDFVLVLITLGAHRKVLAYSLENNHMDPGPEDLLWGQHRSPLWLNSCNHSSTLCCYQCRIQLSMQVLLVTYRLRGGKPPNNVIVCGPSPHTHGIAVGLELAWWWYVQGD